MDRLCQRGCSCRLGLAPQPGTHATNAGIAGAIQICRSLQERPIAGTDAGECGDELQWVHGVTRLFLRVGREFGVKAGDVWQTS